MAWWLQVGVWGAAGVRGIGAALTLCWEMCTMQVGTGKIPRFG